MTHIPIEKRIERQALLERYKAWRESGGTPTVITKEVLRAKGMRKLSKNIAIGDHYVGRYVIGEKQAGVKLHEGMTA